MELLAEKDTLGEKQKALKLQIEEKQAKCNQLTELTAEKSAVVDTLKSFIKSFQGDSPSAPDLMSTHALITAPVTTQSGLS